MITEKILCTICARGGSRGIANKNIRPLLGKPMIVYSIEQALRAGIFEHIVVSTDSDEISRIAINAGAESWFRRPAELSSDTAAKLPVIRHALLESESYYKETFDIIIDLDATAPLRLPEDITGAYNAFIDQDCENLITAVPARKSPYFNLVELNDQGRAVLSKQPHKPIVRRQDSPQCYDMNASIYIWKREALMKNETLFNEKTGLYVMPDGRCIDIDSELDLKFMEFIMTESNYGSAGQ